MCAYVFTSFVFQPFCLLFFAPLDRVVQGVTPQNTRQVTPTLSTKEPQQVGENDGITSRNGCAATPAKEHFCGGKRSMRLVVSFVSFCRRVD